MNKIIVLLTLSIALSACGSIPTAVDTAQESLRGDVQGSDNDAPEATEVQVATDGSGLGTIVHNSNTRAKPCKRQRRTGSHIYSEGCFDPDGGSQPVRYGTWNDLGRYAMSGSVRPEH